MTGGEAKKLSLEALAIFERQKNVGGIARVCFSLAIQETDDAAKLRYALRSADCYREIGIRDDAARVVLYALPNPVEEGDLYLEPKALLALEDAQAAGNRSLERRSYFALARFAAARKDSNSATRYSRWADEIESSEGSTPLERWESDLAFTKMMIQVTKDLPDKTACKDFRAKLRELKAKKPARQAGDL